MTEQEDRVEALLTEYSEKLPQFERCTKRFRDLLEQVLEAANLGGRIHSVTCRPKDIDRLREKLAGGDRKYSNLSDVTDLIGLRVITYFGEDVDDVASVIEAEFKIDAANSMDKRQALDPDRFGYLSLHYVCNLNEGRAALPEYASLTNLPFEIQVRSILQHAWAEIEHDLGYKTKEAIPVQSQRRFARLAGLLELADDEFRGIRKDLDAYAARVPAEIEQDPAVVRIDKVSLDAFIEHDDVARALDQEIAELWGCGLKEPYEDDDIATYFKYLGFETIDEVQVDLAKNREATIEMVKRRFPEPSGADVSRGIGLFHLFYLLLGQSRDEEQVVLALERFHLGSSEEHAHNAEEIVRMANEVSPS